MPPSSKPAKSTLYDPIRSCTPLDNSYQAHELTWDVSSRGLGKLCESSLGMSKVPTGCTSLTSRFWFIAFCSVALGLGVPLWYMQLHPWARGAAYAAAPVGLWPRILEACLKKVSLAGDNVTMYIQVTRCLGKGLLFWVSRSRETFLGLPSLRFKSPACQERTFSIWRVLEVCHQRLRDSAAYIWQPTLRMQSLRPKCS